LKRYTPGWVGKVESLVSRADAETGISKRSLQEDRIISLLRVALPASEERGTPLFSFRDGNAMRKPQIDRSRDREEAGGKQ
jgi:hypothetical protein